MSTTTPPSHTHSLSLSLSQETEFRAEQTRPRLRAAPPPPPHTASRRKRAPLSPPSSVRAGGAGAGTSNSVADLAAALHGLDRIKRRRHALLRSRDRLDAEVQTLREQMLRPGIARAEKERLAGGVARASVESDKLRARLESPGMAQLAKEERRLRALAAAGGGGGAVAAAVAPLSEGKRAEQLAALLAEGEEEEGGDGAERLPRLLDVDGDGFVSAGDLRHALDAATPGQVWTERHALRLLASALGGGGGGGGGTDGATYPQLAAAADSVTAALRAAVRRGATLRDAQAKARLLAGAAERRRRRCAALEAEAAAARRAAAEAGREVAATAAGADGAVALPRLVRKRDAALGRLRAAEEGLRAAEAAAPEAVLTPREEGLLRDQRCGRVQVRLEREREAAACPFAQAPKTCEAVRARTARHRAQRTLRLERWRAAHPSLCAHDAASAPSHHPGTPTARPPSCPRSPSASSAQAGSAVRRCPPRRAPPAAVQVYSLEHPALQGVYVYDAAFEERGGGGGEEDGEGGGMRWIRSADGARIEFADATGVWEMWAGAGAAGAASKGLRSRSGDVVLGAVEWEGCAETTVVELPSRVRGGGKRDKSRVAGSLKGCGGGGGSGNPWHAVYASHPTTSSAFRACPPPQRRREGGRGGDEGGGGGDALHSALTSAHARGSMGVNTYEALRTYSPPYAPFS